MGGGGPTAWFSCTPPPHGNGEIGKGREETQLLIKSVADAKETLRRLGEVQWGSGTAAASGRRVGGCTSSPKDAGDAPGLGRGAPWLCHGPASWRWMERRPSLGLRCPPTPPPVREDGPRAGGRGVSRGGGGARGGVAQGPRAEPIRRREGPAHPEGVQSRGVIAWTSSWGGGGAEEVRRVRTAETRDIERDRSKEREAPRERLVRSKVFERCLPEAGCGMQAGVVPETDPGDRASALGFASNLCGPHFHRV